MVGTTVYDYVNVLDKASDAAWLRHQVISNNISNDDTPGYKRQDVDFESALKRELGASRYTTVDAKVSNVNLGRLNVSAYTDMADFSYRLDGNNVDMDQESANLASNQLRYQALTQCVTHEFTLLQSVMK